MNSGTHSRSRVCVFTIVGFVPVPVDVPAAASIPCWHNALDLHLHMPLEITENERNEMRKKTSGEKYDKSSQKSRVSSEQSEQQLSRS